MQLWGGWWSLFIKPYKSQPPPCTTHGDRNSWQRNQETEFCWYQPLRKKGQNRSSSKCSTIMIRSRPQKWNWEGHQPACPGGLQPSKEPHWNRTSQEYTGIQFYWLCWNVIIHKDLKFFRIESNNWERWWNTQGADVALQVLPGGKDWNMVCDSLGSLSSSVSAGNLSTAWFTSLSELLLYILKKKRNTTIPPPKGTKLKPKPFKSRSMLCRLHSAHLLKSAERLWEGDTGEGRHQVESRWSRKVTCYNIPPLVIGTRPDITPDISSLD